MVDGGGSGLYCCSSVGVVNELKNIIRKANQMVPPPMKDMLPQDMKDAMNKVDQ